MNRLSILVVAAIVALLGTAAAALDTHAQATAQRSDEHSVTQEQTVVFVVEKMNCGLCPVTVRKAMSDVPGVKSVTVDFESKTATVVFNPATVSAAEIAAASSKVGYPATVEG